MSRTRRTAGGLLALALLAGLTGPAATPAQAQPRSTATAPAPTAQDVIVRTAPGALAAVSARVEALGGTVTRTLALIDGLAVQATPAVLAQLQRDPRVREVTPDAPVRLAGSYDATSDPSSLLNVTTVVAARQQWRDGLTGKGIGIALLDSGVTPVEGLADAGKVVHGADLSFDSQSDGTRHLDGYGHGTHLAGIIAGRDPGADPARPAPGDFLGVAPDARIVSVKVADAYGATDVSQVIAGIDWVVQHKDDPGREVRVLNLSLGTASTQSYLLDPLAHAAEQAWHAGLVVVVSAGNDGTGTGKLLNPAQDPYVLAVGAETSNGTMSVSDDTIPDFSTRGDGTRNPDVVAPGSSVASLRVPGSFLDLQHPGAVVGKRFFRGSGTSQAAAVVSGAAALLLQDRPGLTNDQVKAALMDTAELLRAADRQAQGKGLVRVDRARKAGTSASKAAQGHPRSSGTGSLDAARGGFRLSLDGVVLDGETDVFGTPFDSRAHAAAAEARRAWQGGRWNGSTWTGDAWTGTGWAATPWTGSTWSSRTWASRTWASGTWNSRTWAGQSWADDTSLTAGALQSRTWASRTWASRTWAAGSWG